MSRGLALWLISVVCLCACGRSRERDGGPGSSAPSHTASAAPSPPPSGPRALCPLTIEPGVALGPVRLGESLPQLEDAGLVVTKFRGDRAELIVPGPEGPSVTFHVSTCRGAVTRVWVDDVAALPDCVPREARSAPIRVAVRELADGESCPPGRK